MNKKETLQDIQDYLNHDFVIVKKKKQRTEEEILKDFEKLDYKRNENNSAYMIRFERETENYVSRIEINKVTFGYCKYEIRKKDCFEKTINIRTWEHKLLHELFELWEWL